MRYDFDGYGWKYIDSGSGSDWQTRKPDAEPLYSLEQLKAAEARGMEKAARIVEGMGTSFDSTAGERFAKAIRAALNGGQHE